MKQSHTTVLERNMLLDVRRPLGSDLLRHRRLAHQFLDLRVLTDSHMRFDVGVVVLPDEGFDGLPSEDRHRCLDRIHGFDVVFDWDKLVDVLQIHDFQHLTMQLGEVVDVRSATSELQRCLVLHDPLGHS